MKTLFPEHFPITEQALEELWSEGIVVFDTNTLLRLYRYKQSTSDEILNLWKNLGDRLWIPYQVGWEYNRNRAVKIREAVKIYNDIVSDLRSSADAVTNKLRDIKDFGIHPQASLEADLEALVSTIIEKTDEVKSKYDASPTSEHYASIHLAIGNIFDGKIGSPPTEQELEALLIAGQERFDRGEPPGLRDVVDKRKRNRPDQEVFGDFIIWRQLISYAKAQGKSVLFVTEDAKDDWWLKEEGRTIGILPSLRAEFLKEVGKEIHFYRIGFFLEQAREKMLGEVSPDSVQDVERAEDMNVWFDVDHVMPLSSAEHRNMFLVDRWINHVKPEMFNNLDLSDLRSENRGALSLVLAFKSSRRLYEHARSQYRALSKSTRAKAAKGEGSAEVLQQRADYLRTKKDYEAVRTQLETYLGSLPLSLEDDIQ